MFVKKGDKVRVIAGKDKGTEAVVLKALPKVSKVVVEGVAFIKKHQSAPMKIRLSFSRTRITGWQWLSL